MAKVSTATKEREQVIEGLNEEKTSPPLAKQASAVEAYADDAGEGMDDVGMNEMIIPFIRILQSNSPQCKPPEEGGIEGAVQGRLINTATNEVYDGKAGLTQIPVLREHKYIEYIPREKGGGFVALYDPPAPALTKGGAVIKPAVNDWIQKLIDKQGKFGKLTMENGNELIETFSFYSLFRVNEDADWRRAVFAYASTQIKKYQMVMSTLNDIKLNHPTRGMVPYPIYAHAWNAATVGEKNKHGAFYGWRYTMIGGKAATARLTPDSQEYQMARDFHKLIKEGAVKVDYNKAQSEDDAASSTTSTSDRDAGTDTSVEDKEIPF